MSQAQGPRKPPVPTRVLLSLPPQDKGGTVPFDVHREGRDLAAHTSEETRGRPIVPGPTGRAPAADVATTSLSLCPPQGTPLSLHCPRLMEEAWAGAKGGGGAGTVRLKQPLLDTVIREPGVAPRRGTCAQECQVAPRAPNHWGNAKLPPSVCQHHTWPRTGTSHRLGRSKQPGRHRRLP